MIGNLEYARGLGRAFIGAVLFALPLFMTMEMWQLGFTMERERLIALLAVTFPMLVGLSYVAGFERAFGLVDHVLDAFAAIAIAAFAGTVVLILFGVLAPGQPVQEIVGKIAVVTFPGAIGALLADKQIGKSRGHEDDDRGDRSYLVRLFLMCVGALFVALNVAPTEEMVLIAFQISPWQALVLAIASLLLLQVLLYWVDFRGGVFRGEQSFSGVLFRYAFAGYALCIGASLLLLWAFGRTEGVSVAEVLEFAVVLAFPAVLGAGLAHSVVAEQRE